MLQKRWIFLSMRLWIQLRPLFPNSCCRPLALGFEYSRRPITLSPYETRLQILNLQNSSYPPIHRPESSWYSQWWHPRPMILSRYLSSRIQWRRHDIRELFTLFYLERDLNALIHFASLSFLYNNGSSPVGRVAGSTRLLSLMRQFLYSRSAFWSVEAYLRDFTGGE